MLGFVYIAACSVNGGFCGYVASARDKGLGWALLYAVPGHAVFTAFYIYAVVG